MSRNQILRAITPWLLPGIALYAVYWKGLWVWFHSDDFSLLWMASLPHHEFFPTLLEPRAQGTYRPLSERLFFHYFYGWFGLNAFPYRMLVFATQWLNLGLFAAFARKLGLGLGTATLAAALWAVHPGLATTMSWSSAYNQALCSTFLLLALLSFVRFCDSGGLGWYALQWLLFLAGFGALEVIAVYPALLLAYCWFFRRDRILWALPMFAGSAAMAWVQMQATALRGAELYEISLAPRAVANTMGYYLTMAFGLSSPWVIWLGSITLGGFAIWEAREGRWAALFGWIWAAILLAPYIPLGSHRSAYYLFAVAAGLALAAALGIVRAWGAGWTRGVPATLVLALCLQGGLRYASDVTDFNYEKSIRARNLISGLAYVRQDYPNKTILLTGVDDEFFYGSIYHDLFVMGNLFDVYLAPDATDIRPKPGLNPPDRFILSEEETLLGISRGSLVVYDASGLRLREVTQRYLRYAPTRLKLKEP